MDLMYRISKGYAVIIDLNGHNFIFISSISYQNSPDLRLTWLQHMAEKHTSVSVPTLPSPPPLLWCDLLLPSSGVTFSSHAPRRAIVTQRQPCVLCMELRWWQSTCSYWRASPTCLSAALPSRSCPPMSWKKVPSPTTQSTL